MRDGTLELHAAYAGTSLADAVAVKEVEVIVVALLDGNQVLLAEAITAAGALLGALGENSGALLSYTECVHSLPPNG
jgi:hypothetical protein